MRVLLVALALIAALVSCGATPTPTPRQYTPDDVVRVLTPLGATGFVNTPRASGDQSPNTATDQRSFVIPSIAPKGGQVLFFATAADVAGMQAWYARFPDLAPYVHTKGNVVLQLNSTLPKAEAEKYRAALDTLP